MTITREQAELCRLRIEAAQAALNEALADAYAVGLRGRITARNRDEQQFCQVLLMSPVRFTRVRAGGDA